MAILGEVVAICEDARLNVARHSQHTVLLEAEECLLVASFHFAFDVAADSSPRMCQ